VRGGGGGRGAAGGGGRGAAGGGGGRGLVSVEHVGAKFSQELK